MISFFSRSHRSSLYVVGLILLCAYSGQRTLSSFALADESDAPPVEEQVVDEAANQDAAAVDDKADEPEANEAAVEPAAGKDEDADDQPAAAAAADGDAAQPAVAAQPDLPPKPPRKRPKCEAAALIRFEGMIRPMNEHYFYRKLDEAEKLGVDLVIVEIDSPGGYVDSSFNLAHRIRDIDWATVVVFVPDEALSGAAIMALGCDDILMNKKAVMGDAGPIIQGPDALFRHAPAKIRSHVARRIRDLADTHGRAPALAEAMVDKDLVVFEVTEKATGKKRFMSEAEMESAENPAAWEKGKPILESREDSFLEVNGERAVVLGLADDNAATRDDVAKMFSVKEPLIILEPRGIDTAVVVLNHPFITGLLFIVGLIALYIEMSAPGIGAGGMVSLLCFALFFWSRFLGGTSGMLEVVLFAVGIVFLAIEMFVLPGFGIPGVTGLLLMLAGVLLAGQGFVVPQTGRDLQTFSTSLAVIVSSGAVFLIAATIVSRRMGSIPILRNFALQPAPSSTTTTFQSADGTPTQIVAHHAPVSVGDVGVADSQLRPSGRAKFGENYVDVVADGSFVDPGVQVRVISISGNRVLVREIDE